MDLGRSPTEQEFKEPKRKKKTLGVIPNNPFPIIFWKKLGIPPCTDLWPCYNGFYDGEGVVFSSSEDISDIHSMGYFGRNVCVDGGHESCVPVFRERQWRKMVKWAADSGYIITEKDDAEDARVWNAGSAEKRDNKEEPRDKEISHQDGNVGRKEVEEEDTAVECNLISKDELAIITAEGTEKISEKSDIGISGNQQIHDEEVKEKPSCEEVNEVGKLEGRKNEGEKDKVKGTDVREEPRKEYGEEDKERCMEREGTRKDSQKNNKEEKEVMEVLKEIPLEVNEINKLDKEKEEDSILNGVQSENANKSEVVVKDEVSIVSFPISSEKSNFNLETETSREPALVIEPQEKGKIHNSDDFVEIIEEMSMTKALENNNESNSESLKKRKPKRRFIEESCNYKEKRMKDMTECEDDVILGGSSADFLLDGVSKSSDGVLNSSGECEIVEINNRKTCGEWGGKREGSETDDDVIVVSVDDGDDSLGYGAGKYRKLLPGSSSKDVVLTLGKRQNGARGNVTGQNTRKLFTKKDGNKIIDIDSHGKEMFEGKADLSKCDDVEELYHKGNSLRNCEDKANEKTGSTAGSLKSDGEISPCIVIADSDSEDESERGPQWQSDPSDLLPSLGWLKLLPEEAFFLAYGLGCVQVWDARKTRVEEEEAKIKEKKSSREHTASVDSKSNKDDSMHFSLSPPDLSNANDSLPMASSCDGAKSSVFMLNSSILSDRESTGCDKKVHDENKSILDNEMERNTVATDALSPKGKPKDNDSCIPSVNEKCPSDCSDMNGSITVIDLVDSPPSHKESYSNDNMDPAAESTCGKQVPESMFYFHSKAMSLEELWNAFRLSRISQSSIPFETSYAVYHHFRSKGWVVKPGIRFGGDFLLYKDGPSFYHASYLVVIDSSLPHEGSAITWNTLSGLNRLAENVAKELMICRVEWPESMMESQLWSPKCLDGLTVEEILVKRWVSMKERDADEEVSGDDKNINFIPLAL